jgi:hypothetical protein
MIRRRLTATTAGALAIAGVLSLLWASGGSAAGARSQISLRAPTGGFKLPALATLKTAPGAAPTPLVPASPSSNPLTLPFKGSLSCGSTSSGRPTTCTALGTLIAPRIGPLTNVPLATFVRVFNSGSALTVKFALSQHSVDLLYRYRDPRCTAVFAIVGRGTSAASKSIDTTITVQ